MVDNKLKLYSCFLDLKRAAIFFYQNPKGKTYKIFLLKTLKTLENIRNRKLEKFLKEINQLKKITFQKNFSKEEKMKIADRILTTGILLKQSLS